MCPHPVATRWPPRAADLLSRKNRYRMELIAHPAQEAITFDFGTLPCHHMQAHTQSQTPGSLRHPYRSRPPTMTPAALDSGRKGRRPWSGPPGSRPHPPPTIDASDSRQSGCVSGLCHLSEGDARPAGCLPTHLELACHIGSGEADVVLQCHADEEPPGLDDQHHALLRRSILCHAAQQQERPVSTSGGRKAVHGQAQHPTACR